MGMWAKVGFCQGFARLWWSGPWAFSSKALVVRPEDLQVETVCCTDKDNYVSLVMDPCLQDFKLEVEHCPCSVT